MKRKVKAWLLITEKPFERGSAFTDVTDADYWYEIYTRSGTCKESAEIIPCTIEYEVPDDR